MGGGWLQVQVQPVDTLIPSLLIEQVHTSEVGGGGGGGGGGRGRIVGRIV